MKVLLAVDGSEYTHRMLGYVAAHDELFSSATEFTAVTVVPSIPPHAASFLDRGTLDSYYHDEAEKVLKPVRAFAAQQGRQLRFEAAVGGAMPIVRAIGDGLAGDRIVAIDAILNGTTNAVFTAIDATGCSLDAAVRAAQSRGYAEADPAADLDGDDARAKLAILCALAFGLRVDPSAIGGTSCASTTAADFTRARLRGATIRQVAHAAFDRGTATLTAWVAPTEVANTSLFGQTVGPQNAAIITGAHSGEIGIFGAGAGGEATAVAILSDIAAIARDRAAIVPPPVLTANFILQTSDFAQAEVAC